MRSRKWTREEMARLAKDSPTSRTNRRGSAAICVPYRPPFTRSPPPVPEIATRQGFLFETLPGTYEDDNVQNEANSIPGIIVSHMGPHVETRVAPRFRSPVQ